MASLKKPESCPQCKQSTTIRKLIVTHTAPHYEGYLCISCIQDPGSAIFPDAFIISRPKRVKGICRECGRTPEQVEFKKGKNWCIECSGRYMSKNYRDNILDRKAYHSRPDVKAKKNEAQKKCNTTSPEGWIRHKMHHILKPSQRELIKKGHSAAILDIRIDYQFLIDMYYAQDGKCALLGIPMTHSRNDLRSISVDRIDSKFGYVPGNVQLVCKFANLGKSKHTNEEVRSILDDFRLIQKLDSSRI